METLSAIAHRGCYPETRLGIFGKLAAPGRRIDANLGVSWRNWSPLDPAFLNDTVELLIRVASDRELSPS